MNLSRPLRTDRWLWLVCAAAAFVLLGFVHFHNEGVEGKIGPSHFWGMVVFLPRVTEWWTALTVLAIYAAMLAIPSMVLGWVAQAVIVVVRDVRRQGEEKTGQAPT